jgi:hypothetical protein
MKKPTSRKALLIFAVATLSLLPLLACGDEEEAPVLQPTELVGTWEDAADKGRIVLSLDGTYQFVNASAGPPGIIEGQGDWVASDGGIQINLTSGGSTNFGNARQSPTTLRWSYSVSGGTLSLIELTGLRQVATYTKIEN